MMDLMSCLRTVRPASRNVRLPREYGDLEPTEVGYLWELERGAFLHPISRFCMWPEYRAVLTEERIS
ncbi:hypothetical protein TNCV_1768701 [Trichonephila clavipes]|nr:hypothetical protein TNCV_1768701 [Trichonephila clavipes]